MEKIEKVYGKIGLFFYDRPIKTLLVIFLLVVFFAWQTTYLRQDNSNTAFLKTTHELRKIYMNFMDDFNNSNFALLAVKIKGKNGIFHPRHLARLKSLHKDLEKEVPYLQENGVTSIINVRVTETRGDELFVGDFIEKKPTTKKEFENLKKKAISSPLYINSVISANGKIPGIIIEFAGRIIKENRNQEELLADFGSKSITVEKVRYFGAGEAEKAVKKIKEIVNRYETPDFQIAMAGEPMIMDVYNKYTAKDTGKLTVLSSLVIIIFAFICLRRVSGVFLPLIIAQLGLVSVFGAMALLGYPQTLFSAAIPSFMLIIGTMDVIHVLEIFYPEYEKTSSKREALEKAMSHSGLVITLTSLTTAIGLLSLMICLLEVVSEYGIATAIGVILALFYTLTALPATIALLKLKAKPSSQKNKFWKDKILTFFANFSINNSWKIIGIATILFVISLSLISNMKMTHNLLDYMPDKEKTPSDVKFIDQNLGGSVPLEIILDTGEINGVKNPDFLSKMEIFTEIIGEQPLAGKIFSLLYPIKEMNQAMHNNDTDFYRLPDDKNTISQLCLLFEGKSDDLWKMVDPGYQKTRITVNISWVDLVSIQKFKKEVEKTIINVFGDGVDFQITGVMALLSEAVPQALHGMIKSYLWAGMIITILMILLLRNIKLGIVSMAPNFLPIMIVLATMILAKTPMDLTALVIGVIAIGIVVDDSMHFLYNFKKYFNISGDASIAIHKTFLTTGRAIFTTSVVLSMGFLVLITANLQNNIRFGVYTSAIVIIALLADFLLTPAILNVLFKNKKSA